MISNEVQRNEVNEMFWRDIQDNLDLKTKCLERIAQLSKEGLALTKIGNIIKEEFGIQMHHWTVSRIITSLGIKRKDCRHQSRRDNSTLAMEQRAIRIREKARQRRKRLKDEAFEKIGGNNPNCAHCGCPHIDALTVGHINGSRIHKRRTTDLYRWIKKTPIEIVRQHVRLECVYCNFYEGFNGKYPPKNKLPIWRK